jgi:hypothetical protein
MSVRVAPISMRSARYAVEQWHYSHALPASPGQAVGVWEDERYRGAVIVGRGANRHAAAWFEVHRFQCAELVRVAFECHDRPVSQLVPPALRLIVSHAPALRVLVSFADPTQGHVGGIYQAMNWTYLGVATPGRGWRQRSTGKVLHNRVVSESGWVQVYGRRVRGVRQDECDMIELPGKHRYAWPLDRPMRRQLAAMAQPYPHAVEGSKVSR